MRCLARLMRCAIVDSGTRNARAISAVVRPPTARSVSASCDGAESDGWQHRNSRVSVSSAAGVAQASSAAGATVPSDGRSDRVGVLAPPARRLAAHVVGHPPGRHGHEPAPRVGGDAVGSGHCAAPRPRAPPAPRPRRRRTAGSGARARRGPAARARAAGPRRSAPGAPTGPGSHVVRRLVHERPDLDPPDRGERDAGGDLERPLLAVDVDDVEAARGTPSPRCTGRR